MNNSLRFAIIGFAVCCLISLIFATVYKHNVLKIEYLGNTSDYKKDEDVYVYYIDRTEIKKNHLEIHGWLIKPGINLIYVNNMYVLIDDDNKVYGIKTRSIKRAEVTMHFNDGFNYDNSGLHGQCPVGILSSSGRYRIGILIREQNGNQYIKLTNEYIGE